MTMGWIRAFLTATRVEFTEEGGDTEESGWVDPRRSRYVLFESRNDVTPVQEWAEGTVDAFYDTEQEMVLDYVQEALNALPGGPEGDDQSGTFYSSSSEDSGGLTALDTDNLASYSYAIHFVRKHYGPNGWTEDEWHPVVDGGLDPVALGLATP